MSKQSDNSFQAINYSLRPNKVIARKIIFEALRGLDAALNLGDYHYIGMGSLWFVDFLLAHRALRIRKMISIEADDVGFARACFNVPLKCIDVRHGYTTDVLPTLKLERRKSIIWLDHDTPIEGPALPDMSIMIDACKAGSIIMTTVNANVNKLRQTLNPGAPDKVAAADIRQYLATKIGDLTPSDLSEADIDEGAYPKTVCGILDSGINVALQNSGRELEYVKLFDFVYKDGPPMATVGGFIGSPAEAAKVRTASAAAGWPGLLPVAIQAPPLTLREKMKLDQLLPSSRPLRETTFEKRTGFPLTQKQIAAYVDYYALYPTFAEFQI